MPITISQHQIENLGQDLFLLIMQKTSLVYQRQNISINLSIPSILPKLNCYNLDLTSHRSKSYRKMQQYQYVIKMASSSGFKECAFWLSGWLREVRISWFCFQPGGSYEIWICDGSERQKFCWEVYHHSSCLSKSVFYCVFVSVLFFSQLPVEGEETIVYWSVFGYVFVSVSQIGGAKC